jgi:hypothetical protein
MTRLTDEQLESLCSITGLPLSHRMTATRLAVAEIRERRESELPNRAPDRTTADIQRLADVVLDYMERNGAPPMWATETLCRLIKGGK